MDGETPSTRRQCTARNRRGERCKRGPIAGGTVCAMHGGKAPQVQRKAAERLADLIDPNRALREAARLAYSDVRDLFGPDGNLKPIHELPDHIASAIGSIEVVIKNTAAGDGVTDRVHKIKLWDKPKNIELLFRHLGMLKDNVNLSGTVQVEWQQPSESPK